MRMGQTMVSIDSLAYFDAAAFFHYLISPSNQKVVASTVNGEKNQNMKTKCVLYPDLLY